MVKQAISSAIRRLYRAYYKPSSDIEMILEQHQQGYRFMSSVIHTSKVNASDWK